MWTEAIHSLSLQEVTPSTIWCQSSDVITNPHKRQIKIPSLWPSVATLAQLVQSHLALRLGLMDDHLLRSMKHWQSCFCCQSWFHFVNFFFLPYFLSCFYFAIGFGTNWAILKVLPGQIRDLSVIKAESLWMLRKVSSQSMDRQPYELLQGVDILTVILMSYLLIQWNIATTDSCTKTFNPIR